MQSKTTPPQWLDWLITGLCKHEVFEIVQGDLYELYERNLKKHGQLKAKLLYIRDALTILRPTLLKQLEGNYQLNPYGMFKNHFKTSFRNLKRNPLFTIINALGLAISMSVGIMMILFLSELYDVDDFHQKKDRIYRVTTTQPGLMGDQIDHLATASYFVADQAKEELPEVEKVVVMSWRFKAEIKHVEKRVALSGFYATPSFLDVLSYPLLTGNQQTALDQPESVLLTSSAAKKLFPNSDPVGQWVDVSGLGTFNKGLVTGILQDVPENSYLDFEMVLPMQSNPMINTQFRGNPNNTFENYVYLLLHEHAEAGAVAAKIADVLDDHPYDLSSVTHTLEPMGSFILGATMNANGPTFSSRKVDMMIGLTLIVLLSACFNYTNLSLGRSFSRLKEISVRKVNGATRTQLFTQFMVEAVLVSCLALLLGIGLFFLARPALLSQVNDIIQDRSFFKLSLSWIKFGYFTLFAVSIGVIAGFLPAWILSRLKTSLLLKDVGKIKLLSGMNARKILITFQFSLTIGLIMCAVMVYRQYQFAINYDLGYQTENIVNVNIQGDYMDLLEEDYKALPQVLGTAKSQAVLGLRGGQFGNAISENFQDTTMYSSNYVGSGYFEVHDFDLIAGSGFRKSDSSQSVVVNQSLIKALNMGTPEMAIGTKIRLMNDQQTLVSIAGVVRNFTGVSLDFQMPAPFVFFPMAAGQNGTLGLKIATSDLLETMTQLEKGYQKYDPIHPFNAQFYDDQLASNYRQLQSSYTLISLLAFLAISIATLGLIGIAIYTLESRLKEISIRKVLGADSKSLILLLSRGFMIMIAIATVLAIPVALYVVDEMLLQSFFQRIDVGLLELLSGFLIVFLIAALAVGTQVHQVSAQKPVDLLRDE